MLKSEHQSRCYNSSSNILFIMHCLFLPEYSFWRSISCYKGHLFHYCHSGSMFLKLYSLYKIPRRNRISALRKCLQIVFWDMSVWYFFFSVHFCVFLDRTPALLLISELSTVSKRVRVIPWMQTERASQCSKMNSWSLIKKIILKTSLNHMREAGIWDKSSLQISRWEEKHSGCSFT